MRRFFFLCWSSVLFGQGLEVKPSVATEVHLHCSPVSELVPALESLLGARVFVHGLSSAVPVTLDTTRDLAVSEHSVFVRAALGSSGLCLVPVSAGFLVCAPKDRKAALALVEQDESGALPESRTEIIRLRYLDVEDALEVLRQHFPSGGAGPALDVPAARPAGPASPAPRAPQPVMPASSPLPSVDTRVKAFATLSGAVICGDPSTRTVTVTGDPETIALSVSAIQALDKMPEQVLLNVVIGEYTLNDDVSLGVDVAKLSVAGSPLPAVAGSLFSSAGRSAGYAEQSALQSLAGLSSVARGLSLYSQLGHDLAAYVNALEQTTRFQVLQRPTLTTTNNKPARIYTGQQIAIAAQTLTSSGTSIGQASVSSTTQYVPVRLEIQITPHILGDGQLKLEFEETNNDVSGSSVVGGNAVPNISEQGLHNTLVMASGSTVLLGGLIMERHRDVKSGVPFLVRLPVVGRLFGSTNKTKERRELLVFVSPQILRSTDELRAVSRERQEMNALGADLSARFGRRN